MRGVEVDVRLEANLPIFCSAANVHIGVTQLFFPVTRAREVDVVISLFYKTKHHNGVAMETTPDLRKSMVNMGLR